MTIRLRFTLWFAGILFVSLVAMGALSYYEFVVEPRGKFAANHVYPEESPVHESIEFVAWCGLLPLALALGGGLWLIRRGLAPVTSLTRAAESITEHNLKQRLPRTGNGDELDRLAEVFNAMIERLDQSFGRVREFTLHASHELKTPLTVIHAELETALQEAALLPSEKERLESQMGEIQRLSKIVDALSWLTKADAGQVCLARQPVHLDELVREAHADAQSLARQEEIEVRLNGCEPLMVIGDRHRLRQVLLNLSDNAIKYNHRRGSVALGLQREGDSAVITVSNSGKGIPPAILPSVFERFFRGDPSHSAEIEGCGLGLSIVQFIVRAHGGLTEDRHKSLRNRER